MKEPSWLEEDVGPYEPMFCSWCNTELDPETCFGVGPVNVYCSDECYDEHTERWG